MFYVCFFLVSKSHYTDTNSYYGVVCLIPLFVFLSSHIFLLNCFSRRYPPCVSPSLLFLCAHRAIVGVHAPATRLCQHDHVGAEGPVQCHGVWGGGASRHSHTARQAGGTDGPITVKAMESHACLSGCLWTLKTSEKVPNLGFKTLESCLKCCPEKCLPSTVRLHCP